MRPRRPHEGSRHPETLAGGRLSKRRLARAMSSGPHRGPWRSMSSASASAPTSARYTRRSTRTKWRSRAESAACSAALGAITLSACAAPRVHANGKACRLDAPVASPMDAAVVSITSRGVYRRDLVTAAPRSPASGRHQLDTAAQRPRARTGRSSPSPWPSCESRAVRPSRPAPPRIQTLRWS